ncbi:MAG: ATP-binding protein [Sideroxydans sp.]|nr:ATP-binding protein [Sideroxydans sp.]
MHLSAPRILAEQLRLLLGNVGSSVIPAFLLALLMVWVLSNDSNTLYLNLWCAAVILSKLAGYLHARYRLARDIPPGQTRRVVRELIILNLLDGALWGALAWATLDTSGLAGSILVVSVIAGIAGSSMSLLSPVLPVFIVFAIAELCAIVSKVWLLGDPAYNALGVAGIFYIATLIGQARNSARAARTAIELRFEKTGLVEQLLAEKTIAEQARREAEEAYAAKSKFLAAASHDLRQPIHAQGLFLDVLSHTELSNRQRKLLAHVCAASDASAEMLNTLLDFSRIEAGVIEPKMQAFRMQPLLNKIEREFEQQADAKGLAYRSRETALVVHSDPALIEIILRNLVSNAIRYTAHGGVLVTCRKHGGQAVLEVRDTGIGIAQSQQREVFREFHQLGNPERDRRKGLGLGLAIVNGLARRLDHKLALLSAPQRGSVFRLSLPIASLLPAEERGTEQFKMQTLNMRVLVVEDDAAVRTGMRHLLRDWGCECEAVDSIEEALDVARTLKPDAVVSDYRLREHRTGLEAIAALRQLLGASLPALLITGDTAPDRLREAQAGGIPLLHKPVSPDHLYSELVKVLQLEPG